MGTRESGGKARIFAGRDSGYLLQACAISAIVVQIWIIREEEEYTFYEAKRTLCPV